MFPVLLTGASGLVGSALTQRRPMVPLQRGEPSADLPWWNPARGELIDHGQRYDAVVHLAGASVAERRWSDAWKAQILQSRVQGTRTLVQWLSGLDPERRPKALISASAVGYYGDRGEEILTEESPAGRGFLAETCQAWEAEALRAAELGVRTVVVRIGIVLSAQGGALERMLPAFRVGAGGPLGHGRQWFPWIHIQDLVRILLFALEHRDCPPVINAVAPGICRQAEFARQLGQALRRPSLLPAPAAALRLALGREMADELLLSSQNVEATIERRTDFRFLHPALGPALADLLGAQPVS